jgi:hypothetical protein
MNPFKIGDIVYAKPGQEISYGWHDITKGPHVVCCGPFPDYPDFPISTFIYLDNDMRKSYSVDRFTKERPPTIIRIKEKLP